MLLTSKIAAYTLRCAFNESADGLVGWIEERFTDHSLALPNALSIANDRAWKTVGLALAGDGFFKHVKDLFRERDVTALREQIRGFIKQTPTGLDPSSEGLRVRACEELTRLRKSGRLSHPQSAKSLTSDLHRYGDPSKLVSDAADAVAAAADAVAADAPHLARVLRLTSLGGTPLLASAFLYFFRREVAANRELSTQLTFDSLRALTSTQDAMFTMLETRTEGMLNQLDTLFDTLENWFGEVDGKLDDIRGKLDQLLEERKVATRVTDPLKISVTNERELAQLRSWRDELRKLPPELLRAKDWAKLGDALAAGHQFADAREAHEKAAANARAAQDRTAQAEAEFKAYRDACEQEHWDEALTSLMRAAELDAGRFAPFPMKRFEPVAILGAGGFGTVIRCRDRLMRGQDVAVKTFHSFDVDRDVDEVFAEAHALSELANSAIVKIYLWDFANQSEMSRPYFVMEFFPGVSLAEHLRRQGCLALVDFIPVALQVARGMAAVHARNILHRDLKPGNILVHRESGDWRVRVIDFGLAMRFQSLQASIDTSVPHSTRTRREHSFAGTLEYASPEQKGTIHEKIGPRSDIYSFGKTMLEALLGTTEPTTRNWKAIPETDREDLRELLEGCVEKTPLERHLRFDAIVEALTALDRRVRLNGTTSENEKHLERGAVEQHKETEAARIAETTRLEVALPQRSTETTVQSVTEETVQEKEQNISDPTSARTTRKRGVTPRIKRERTENRSQLDSVLQEISAGMELDTKETIDSLQLTPPTNASISSTPSNPVKPDEAK